MALELDTPVQFLKGVGPVRARRLENLSIATVEDLLHHYPRRHEDRSDLREIRSVREGEVVTVGGTIGEITFRRMRGRLSLVTVELFDETGAIDLVYWNQPFRRNQFREGDAAIVTGKVTSRRGLQLANPEVEILGEDGEDEMIHTGRVVPVYPLTKGVKAGAMRRMVWNAVRAAADLVPEYLPEEIVRARSLPPLGEALRDIHFPDEPEGVARAARRLKYDELFLLECVLALRRQRVKTGEEGTSFRWSREIDRRIRRRFPFSFTGAQDRAVREIVADMREDSPMTRLLQGDVGSGKTAVAIYAILVAVANGRQAGIMAPTEILAEQHHRTFSRTLDDSQVRIELLRGGMPAKRRREILAGLAEGAIDVAVGTHALIQKDVAFADLGLVVVDEQHRFGVLQRANLTWKGRRPDTLFMTATPIPRTLALTAFGDLDVSVIDEMPPGRKPPRTAWFPRKRLPEAHRLIRKAIEAGRQAFIVFPLVEESEEMPLAAVTEEVERLRKEVFPGIPVGLIHGRLKKEEKDRAMRRFRDGKDRILAATTVVEVGIDVPNATVMVVENAERYGLSQLHQLRGRIGRGGGESVLLLLGNPTTDEGRRRLEIMETVSDGFRIATEDLKLRGPGEFFGTRQHGMPDLRLADLVLDFELLEQARRDAFALVARDPGLASETGARIRAAIRRRIGARAGLVDA